MKNYLHLHCLVTKAFQGFHSLNAYCKTEEHFKMRNL